MAGRPDTWMPMYWRDYLADTRNLTTEQHGAYMLLIAFYWTTGQPLPDDDEQLAIVAGVSLSRWRAALRPRVMSFFRFGVDGWRHKRIDAELLRASNICNARQANGRVGGLQKASKRLANGLASGKQNPTPSQPQPPSSDASASGAAAPLDPAKLVFSEGRKLLIAAGRTPDQAGKILGGWRKDYTDSDLIAAIGACVREGAEQPVEFIAGCLRRTNGKRDGKGDRMLAGFAAALSDGSG